MGALIKLPNAATPAERILARFNYDQLSGFIEVAISLLDAADTEPDLEDGDEDCCSAGDDKPEAAVERYPTAGNEDDGEDGDPTEENGDEEDTGLAEDEELPGLASHWGRYWNGGRAGCPISDPHGSDGSQEAGFCPTFGIDQTDHVSEGEAFHDLNGIPLTRVPLPENDQ